MTAQIDGRSSVPLDQRGMYLHCARCGAEKPPSRSMEEFARLAVIRTAHGLQIWCNRHSCNVAYITMDWGSAMPSCGGCAVCGKAESH
jgi:phage terminase large subunit GpA-like protein